MPRFSSRWQLIEFEKRRSLYLLPSYALRLLALPCLCWTATQKPTLVYTTNTFNDISDEISAEYKTLYIQWTSTVATSLTQTWNFARISERQESARINAFFLNVCSPHSSSPVPRSGLMRVGLRLQKYNLFLECTTSMMGKRKKQGIRPPLSYNRTACQRLFKVALASVGGKNVPCIRTQGGRTSAIRYFYVQCASTA